MTKWLLALGLVCVVLFGNSIHSKATTEKDLKPLIEQAGTGTLILADQKEVTYVVNEPIIDVKCSIQGAPGGSYIKANFQGDGDAQTPFLLRYSGGVNNISIKDVTFDLDLVGRGAVHFYQNTNVLVENSSFTGYSKTYGYNMADSSISFTDCQGVEVANNHFFDNGYQYGMGEGELNRCVTFQGEGGNGYSVYNNEFTRVNQGVVVQGNNISRLDIYNNAFNAVVDNSIYLLNIPVANIYNNDFNKDKATESPDEGIVLAGGDFKITNNRVYNVLNKFVAVNGEIQNLEVTNNSINTENTSRRPALVAWRNNTAYTVKKLNFSNNILNIDTAPTNYDVLPIGRVKELTIKDNQFVLSALADYQYLFSLQGQAPIENVAMTGNKIQARSGNIISPKSLFLREKSPILPEISQLLISGNEFAGQYPDILKPLPEVDTIAPLEFKLNIDTNVTGTYTGAVKYVALKVGDTTYSKVPVVDDLNWQYYSKGKITNTTTPAYIVGYDSTGTKILEVPIKVTTQEDVPKIVSDTYTLGDGNVTGTYAGAVKYVALKVGDTTYSKVPVVDALNWQYYSKGKITNTTTPVYILGYDGTGIKTLEVPVKIIMKEEVSTLTSDSYTLGEGNVKGTYTGTVRYVAVKVGATIYSKVPVNADGTYQYYIKDKVSGKNDIVTVLGYDSTGTIVAQKIITINTVVAPVPTMVANDFVVGTTKEVTGTATGGIQYVGLKVGDKTYDKVPISADGTYKYYAKDKITNTASKVTVLGYDSIGLVLEKPVLVK
ncbi:right-handed parallel beta-helix repeat-containing protein [Listeria weihenstephanensis]|uniref:Right-handed parallel beta-helix repeat-containing protein n=1 Tax=Listeria weihenstephanensis TaxID=1006155 RepID=A0A841Z4C0_9LIST|nr:right-handed parallel beta-helix repeat-containing protein [Listeria weihenstephanensis]MBC1500781.1 right-handed parallel beta-helix repeat-containing protein [Listeria weihenstephanensis]